jgi:integrase
VTVRGKRKDAEKELTRLIGLANDGMLTEPSKTTIAEYFDGWLGSETGLSGKTLERYRGLAEQQIKPHLAPIPLQKLKPADIERWHQTLLKSGGKGGKSLSAQTVLHAHRVLRTGLARALRAEIIARNPATAISPPRIPDKEIRALSAAEMADTLARLRGHDLYPIAFLALATGARRGELLALRWTDIDLDKGMVKIERSLEETSNGLRFKGTKTKNGKRTITLPGNVTETLRQHRKATLEHRLHLGMGKPDADALVFTRADGSPWPPDDLSRNWRRTVKARNMPVCSFHGLRHSHASSLIANGIDILSVSRRLGHASPTITLATYGHMIEQTDAGAARAIEAAMNGQGV